MSSRAPGTPKAWRHAPQAIVFDLDGVLVDSMPLWRRAEVEVFGALGVRVDEAALEQTAGMSTRAVTRFWHERCPWGGTSLEDAEQAVIERVCELARSLAAPMGGAARLLAQAQAFSSRLAIATNAPRVLAAGLVERLFGDSIFGAVVTADCVPAVKPAPDVYLEAARRLGAQPTACVAIDDSPRGVQAALAAGMVTIGVGIEASDLATERGCILVESVETLDLAKLLGQIDEPLIRRRR
ncbi:MAG: HAD family phosphatase [Gammaproteobacteria bacterium]